MPREYSEERRSYAACLMERAFPAEKREAELRKTMQVLVDALKCTADLPVDHYPNDHDDEVLRVHAEHAYVEANDALSLASEKHGITPTSNG